MEIDIPEVVAEVRAAFDRYEKALTTNDVTVLDETFRVDPRTIRYGMAEILYGHHEVAGWARPQHFAYCDHHLWPGFRGGVHAVSPRHLAGQGRAPDADLGALSRGLAGGGGPRESDRRAEAGVIFFLDTSPF